MNINHNVDRETYDLAKHAALKFLGDDPYICEQFLFDISYPKAPYPAPEIIYQIASHLRDFSQLYLNVIAAVVVAYIFYLKQKREPKKSQEELETKLRNILEEYQNQIVDYLKKNEELRSRFKNVNLKKIYIRVKPDMETKWQLRLKTYSDRANLLINHDDAVGVMITILKEVTNDKLNSQK